jgi:hypothetical protein
MQLNTIPIVVLESATIVEDINDKIIESNWLLSTCYLYFINLFKKTIVKKDAQKIKKQAKVIILRIFVFLTDDPRFVHI